MDRSKITWHILSAKVPKPGHFADRICQIIFEPTITLIRMI